jgi:hypothetical protein
MGKKCQRLTALAVFMFGVLVLLATPATAAPNQISGSAFYETPELDVCPPPPAGYADFTSYPPLVMSGSLDGCWYTKVETSTQTPSGAYLETGEEVFVGSLNGGPKGTLATTYKFEAKLAPDGSEIRGRCQHPIIGGTGGFASATGVILFKDAPPEYFYRGHIKPA